MQYIQWIEPLPMGSSIPIYFACPVDIAIKRQRDIGLSHGHVYCSDEVALLDFMTTHWAEKLPRQLAPSSLAT